MQALDLVERQAGAGRIVRIGEKDDLGLFRHRGKNCIDVRSEILLRRHHRLRAGAERHDRINQESMRGVDRLVAVDQIGVRKQMQQIVRARTADDAVGIEPERAPDRLTQLACRAVRIVLKVVGGGLIGRDRLRARPERRLVRRQFYHLGHARRAAFTGHIGLDLEHAGPGLRTRCRHYFLTPGSDPSPFQGEAGTLSGTV